MVVSPEMVASSYLQSPQQHTLATSVSSQGVGLHSGATVRVTLSPAEPHQGRVFVRTDLPDAAPIPACPQAVYQTQLSTELAQGKATVRTVEHLLAALTGLGIDNACIQVDGPELPLLDGSAQDWVTLVAEAGTVNQGVPRRQGVLGKPVTVYDGDAFVSAVPAPTCRLTYGINFPVSAIGEQWFSWSPAGGDFSQQVAPARTFALAHQIDQLRALGLIKGGSLENALVCGPDGWLNPPLRFDNEPARHKLLDLIGDLSLLGGLPQAHIVAYKASHKLHVTLAESLTEALEFCERPI